MVSAALKLSEGKLAYRIEEAADATGLGRTTLYRRIKAGRLTARKDGKLTLILREDLQAYLDGLPAIAEAGAN